MKMNIDSQFYALKYALLVHCSYCNTPWNQGVLVLFTNSHYLKKKSMNGERLKAVQ